MCLFFYLSKLRKRPLSPFQPPNPTPQKPNTHTKNTLSHTQTQSLLNSQFKKKARMKQHNKKQAIFWSSISVSLSLSFFSSSFFSPFSLGEGGVNLLPWPIFKVTRESDITRKLYFPVVNTSCLNICSCSCDYLYRVCIFVFMFALYLFCVVVFII